MIFEVLSPALYVLGICSASSGQNHRTPYRSFVPWTVVCCVATAGQKIKAYL